MTKRTIMTAKTLGAVMAVGSAAAFITSSMNANKSKKLMKKKTEKAVKTISDIIDGIQSVM